ncbi:Gfo/Idh/MocA family oxidoreductase [Luminiphilus sp.]|nr:Gfo/Idh/MocA family oxidoreductase [Luminiphilus sp.]
MTQEKESAMYAESSRRKLSLGFVGGGLNSAVGYTHFLASRMDGFFSVDAGFFSRDPSVNAETATTYGVSASRCYDNLDALLESERGNLDALCILTPIPDHIHSAIKAMNAGFDIICEKALASSENEAQAIYECQRATGRSFLITFNYVGYPMVREAKAMISRGDLGVVQQGYFEMPQESFARPEANPQSWRRRDYGLPCVTLDLGVHVHHMIEYLLSGGGFEPVAATTSSFGRIPEVLDTVNTCGWSRTKNIMLNSMWTKAALGYANGLKFRVFGSAGSIEWHQTRPEELSYTDSCGKRMSIERGQPNLLEANKSRYNRFKAGHPAGFVEAFANIYSDFHAILTGAQQEHPVYGIGAALQGLSDLHQIHKLSVDKPLSDADEGK